MKLNTALSVLAAAGFAGAAMANDPTAESTSTAHADKTKLVSKLEGKDIHSAENRKIGEIEDFVVDESGQITHAVVSYGGTLGMGDKQTLVPWDHLTSNMQDERIVLERTELESAPEVTEQELLAGGAWRMEIDQHWESDEAVRTAEAEPTGTTSESETVETTGETPVTAEPGSESEPSVGTHDTTSSEIDAEPENDPEEQPPEE
jgi:sporulation protein YlmC with PRC-barrel domain